jgi:hypothetical protein
VSPTKKPSAVSGLRRGVGATPPAEDPTSSWRGKRVSEMTDAEVQAMATGQPPRPEKPVRFTLDLDQDRHAFLKAFALECGAGVGGAQVLRALLDELREGPNLTARVQARIWAGKR